MRSLVYAGIALWTMTCLWLGMCIAVANRPIPLVKIIHAEPAKWTPPNCVEQFRVCQQQKRSHATKGKS